MEKVQIFNTYEEMLNQIGQGFYDNNLKTREILSERLRKIELDYKEKSGFNERSIRQQEEIKKQKGYGSIIPPDMIALPEDEWEKLHEQHSYLGKDLELTALVGLCAVGSKYDFDGFSEQDLGVSYSSQEEHDDIGCLVQAVKDILPQLEGRFYGAKLTLVIYTTKTDEPIVPEHILNDVPGFVKEISQEVEGDDFIPEEAKEQFIESLWEFASCQDRYRGLNEEECREFERLFYSNK